MKKNISLIGKDLEEGSMISEYWKEQIEKVVKISKRGGHPELDATFWIGQPITVVTLIIKLFGIKTAPLEEE